MKNAKRLVSLFLATAIGICSATSAYADDEIADTTNMNTSSISVVSWNETYSSLEEVMEHSDVCIIGTVVSQEIEQRYDLYLTHSYVVDEYGETYDVVQAGAIINNDNVNIPYDLSLLELGEQYFLCLNQTEYDDTYGQYYLITGGNQGYGLYSDEIASIIPLNTTERNVFSSSQITIDNLGTYNITSVSALNNDDVNVNNPQNYIWASSSLVYFVQSYIASNYGSTIVSQIRAGINAWNGITDEVSISNTAYSSRANIIVNMGDYGSVGFAGRATLSGSGTYQLGGTTFTVITSGVIDLNASVTNGVVSGTLWKALACHEMGHILGLPHNNLSNQCIMWPYYIDFYTTNNITTPQTLDRGALINKYENGVIN